MKKNFESYVQAILAADKAAREVNRPIDDGGTCNFDSLIVNFKGWRQSAIDELAAQTGVKIGDALGGWHKGYRFVNVASVGQGINRTRMAEAAKKAFNEMIDEAAVWYQMD